MKIDNNMNVNFCKILMLVIAVISVIGILLIKIDVLTWIIMICGITAILRIFYDPNIRSEMFDE